ncbi:MAG: hypothetical protein A3F72_13595 [Bacteroidetes bacterium RIFCSPLOWO2_12_FULL_35_15]|nr:MAG: hypothetical protein A3F72_13595 [Bacteroidetes bacterium RIFCSPLOWO2_12_FULL_35_15]
MKRDFYSENISTFLNSSSQEILGALADNNDFSLEQTQKDAWNQEIRILKEVLKNYNGSIFFEYSIPRMGRRIDVVLLIRNVIFILEFKVGEKEFLLSALDQVSDYALDLKNFHKTSHLPLIAPILIATHAKSILPNISLTHHNDNVLFPIKTNTELLVTVIDNVLQFADGEDINTVDWAAGNYSPTPTIIEAAMALYNGHSVSEISRSDASAKNLRETSNAISKIIRNAKENNEKAICFVTGVPGAGKTLVGLNVAAKHFNKAERSSTVFLSGNGPLVSILREALTRDKVKREKQKGNKVRKGEILSSVKAVIQNVHHFRDECLKDINEAPFEHVTIFDEAQRAWNLTQTANFMQRKKNHPNFSQSEPNFLISCLDRHKDWAVIICLVGGGQEINTGEAGISEWIESLNLSFPKWHIFVSNKLTDSEYAAGNALQILEEHKHVIFKEELHLSVSLRSFRAEHLSLLMKNLLDLNLKEAQLNYQQVKTKYPIVITRDLEKAKKWLKEKARGSERYGIVVSSQAQRLKPLAIDVKSPMEPIHWFLDEKNDVRSSFYLEDVATEFHVQGLELDWACVTWDADFRFSQNAWQHFSFVGTKWHNIKKEERKIYLKNAYRVLLTRARQGMIIVVPSGDIEDHTRNPNYYNSTFDYLKEIGFEII